MAQGTPRVSLTDCVHPVRFDVLPVGTELAEMPETDDQPNRVDGSRNR
jgi:hypothetical protein